MTFKLALGGLVKIYLAKKGEYRVISRNREYSVVDKSHLYVFLGKLEIINILGMCHLNV